MKILRTRIPFAIRDALDRRNAEQQQRADQLLEANWRARVAMNPKERARLAREAAEAMPGLLKKQALDLKRAPLVQGEPASTTIATGEFA